MKLKHLVVAAAVACGSAGAFAVDLGPIPPTASFSMSHGAGAFLDTWSFDLGTESIVAASLTNVAVTFGSLSTGVITGFAATLNGVPLNLASSTVFNPPVTVKTQVLTGSSQFGPGTFVLEVSGTAGAGGASYGGNIVAIPVPEPETYAMMLAGLGALGFLARRRKS
ncbi:MAG: PEP-CTERM sorting domain-containing protein [Burkholderiaceae bacterium]|nr:PEP-CTERM sorting domain-containing protein [Burkholderiaceae bacterium]